MVNARWKPQSAIGTVLFVRRLYGLLAPRAYSVIMFAALFCTLAAKFFHSWRYERISEYFGWILADVSVLLGLEVILAIICFRWPRKWIIRTSIVVAAVACTWSVMNAGWLIRTGTQILPAELVPLFRDPLNSLGIVGVNLVKMPAAAIALLGPSAITLTFLFFVLLKPTLPNYDHRRFTSKVVISVIVILGAVAAHGMPMGRGSVQIASAGLRYNCQLRAVTSLLWPDFGHLARTDFTQAKRTIPTCDQIAVKLTAGQINHNVIIVILEGIQYNYTSLADTQNKLTPYLGTLAKQGVEFANARSTLTHTTKSLFAMLTGRFPSVSQDIAETVPALEHYGSIATIVEGQLGFRTAFFQSAKGNFESRPGLVHNLGFDKFWARDDLNDPNSFLGYLACDEFSMLKPIMEWMEANGGPASAGAQKPFFLTILCSVTHDPYEVPRWFATPANEKLDCYRQAVFYTDKFLEALDVELAKLNLADKTILCVIGDHGEAFGEHHLLGHERIAFEEALRVPWVIRAPFLVEPGARITAPVSSVDLTPTLLGLLGFDTDGAAFDGSDALGTMPPDRKVYFSAGWMHQGPVGFVKGDLKFVYNPTSETVSVYDLSIDPLETLSKELPEEQGQRIAEEIVAWRKNSIFRINQQRTGEKLLFDRWLCRWTGRGSSVKYQDSD